MFYKNKAAIILFVFLISIPGFSSGRDFVASGHLTQKALETLIEANKSKCYKIKLLKKKTEENLQLVVFASEIHVKNEHHSELGKSLLAHFKVRGFETCDTGGSCEREAAVKVGTSLYQCGGYISEEQHQGNMHDAQVEALNCIQRNTHDSTNFWLEANHQPNLSEKIASVYYPVYLSICATAVCSFLPYVGSLFPESYASILQGLASVLITQTSVFEFIEQRYGYEWILPMNGFVHGRDQTMVKNLNQLLMDQPELRSILLIVGKKHVSGMVQLLVKDHEFEVVELE